MVVFGIAIIADLEESSLFDGRQLKVPSDDKQNSRCNDN
jgi:hypothetical protein